MTTRNEPQIGGTDHFSPTGSPFEFAGLFGGKKAAKTPEQLMNDALAGFTQAQANLEAAQAEIAKQTAEHEAEIEKRQRLLEVANESHSRLGRVAVRFKELLA